MDIYYLFYGERECGFIMVKTGKKLPQFDQEYLDTFMRATCARVYFGQVSY